MMESHLFEGNQKISDDLKYGQRLQMHDGI